jgi:hypothetical protein
MANWVESLSVGQKIFLRGVFMILGLVLLVVVFYAGGLEMLLLSDTKTEWGTLHWIFSGFALLFISLSLALERIVMVYDLIIKAINALLSKLGIK